MVPVVVGCIFSDEGGEWVHGGAPDAARVRSTAQRLSGLAQRSRRRQTGGYAGRAIISRGY